MPPATSSAPAADRPARRLSRRRRLTLTLGSTALSVLVFGAVFAATRVHSPASGTASASSVLAAGDRAPVALRLAPLGGGASVTLAAEVGHRPAVVNFFASWCTACAKELDAFGAVSARAKGAVAFVGIDTNDSDHSLAEKLLRAGGVRYPVLVDGAGLQAATAYGVDALPATFFLDASGRVVGEVLGAEDAPALSARLRGLEGHG